MAHRKQKEEAKAADAAADDAPVPEAVAEVSPE
ncbi:unannotated protein [freshwater metagenome]